MEGVCKEVIKKMESFQIEKTYNKLLTVIRDVIDNHGLLNHDLNEVFNKELGVTKQINSNKKMKVMTSRNPHIIKWYLHIIKWYLHIIKWYPIIAKW